MSGNLSQDAARAAGATTTTAGGAALSGANAAALIAVPAVSDLEIARGPYLRGGKRFVDALGAGVLLIVLSPVLACVALAVRLTLGSGVLFRQARVGRLGKPFDVVKFRTMRHDRRAGEDRSYVGTDRRNTHKTADDPRHTGVGRFLRKWSLDELPQLLNVVRGDMSLVGPRPELVDVAEKHGLIDHPRHLVRPGITGAWQISPLRTELLHENVEIDAEYVQRVTLWADTKILVRTVFAVVRGRGA